MQSNRSLKKHSNMHKVTSTITSGELGLPFYISTLGRTYREVCVNWSPTDKCFLVYSEKGEGEVFFNGEWVPMPEGTAVYWPYNAPIKYHPRTEEAWQTLFITFAGKNAQSILGKGQLMLSSPELSMFSEVIDRMIALYDDERFTEYSCSALLQLLLMIKRLASAATPQEGRTKNNAMYDSVKYVMENFSQDISLTSLAERCGFSEEYYSRQFKELTGATFTSYIISLRLSKACDMLNDRPDKRIADIAFACGFSSAAYFNRVFKKQYGMTPGEYKQTLEK